MSDEEIASLGKLLDRYKHKPGKGDDYDAWDLEFHTRIINGSGNERLRQMLHEDVTFLLRVHRSRSNTTRKIALRVLEEHQEIVAALARRDSAAAEKAMRRHIRHARDVVDAVWSGKAATVPANAPAGKRTRNTLARTTARGTAIREL